MNFDNFESAGLKTEPFDLKEKLASLRGGFESSVKTGFDAFMDVPDSFEGNILRWLGIAGVGPGLSIDLGSALSFDQESLESLKVSAMDTVKDMYTGVDLGDGNKSLSLKEIEGWKKNDLYKDQIRKQRAGFTAEIIGTAKENLMAMHEETGIITKRADDLPELFKKNDQYVDKVRIDSTGKIIERIQVKFVGGKPAECLNKLTSKKYDKYFEDGMVDKIEVPKDFFDEMKNLIPDKISSLEKQLKHVTEQGKNDAIIKIKNKIDRFKKIDNMLEKSTLTRNEALEAVDHPKRYAAKLFAKDTFAESFKEGTGEAKIAAVITATVSTVDNVSRVMDGEITAQEAFVDVAKDSGTAGAMAFGTSFVSTAVAQTMSASSHKLIGALGKTGIPAAIVSFGVESYDSVTDYATGVIDEKQLAFDLGENAVQIGGTIGGSALTGAALGSFVPGAGTLAGFGAGMVGGIIGCAIASEAYKSVVEFGGEHIGELSDKAKEMATKTIDIAKDVIPEKVDGLVSSINDFAAENNLPFRF